MTLLEADCRPRTMAAEASSGLETRDKRPRRPAERLSDPGFCCPAHIESLNGHHQQAQHIGSFNKNIGVFPCVPLCLTSSIFKDQPFPLKYVLRGRGCQGCLTKQSLDSDKGSSTLTHSTCPSNGMSGHSAANEKRFLVVSILQQQSADCRVLFEMLFTFFRHTSAKLFPTKQSHLRDVLSYDEPQY